MLKKYADVKNPDSFSNKFRKKRMDFFDSLIADIDQPVKILDVGGTVNFWKHTGYVGKDNIKITLLNIANEELASVNDARDCDNIKVVWGDAVNLSRFGDKQFDVVFSNSTIEHLYTKENQEKMAKEVQRIGKNYFVQTPNKYFPIEPHFLFFLFQFFPVSLKAWMIRHFNLGWRKQTRDYEASRKNAKEIRLLSLRQLRALFPQGKIWKEKIYGVTKSYVIFGGNNF